jgi:hypothetical protein
VTRIQCARDRGATNIMVTKCCWSSGSADDLNEATNENDGSEASEEGCWDIWIRKPNLRRTESVQVHVAPEQVHTLIRPDYPTTPKLLWRRRHAWGDEYVVMRESHYMSQNFIS